MKTSSSAAHRTERPAIDEPPWWSALSAGTLRADLLAGLLGALLVLPQGVAFARLAGMPPAYGLYAAIVPCIVAALAGSSRHVVTGPTNANSLALFAMLSPLAMPASEHYIALALTVTFMVGVLQLLAGLTGIGSVANFISPSVLTGFTSGAACLIAWHAMLDLRALVLPAGTFNLWEAAIAVVTVLLTWAVARWRPRWPAMLMGLVAGWGVSLLAARLASGVPIERLGEIRSLLPPLSLPELSWPLVRELSGMALALTIVALGQSVSIAKAVAERSGQRIDANREFIGQGLANVCGSFFSSYLSCGSLNRSMPNYESGARTPLAAVFSAVLLLVLLAVGGGALAALPMAAIAALLIHVAWSLLALPRVREILRFGRQESASLLVTWAATLLIPIEWAILLGVGVSLLFYLYQTSRPVVSTLLPAGPDRRLVPIEELSTPQPECPQLKLVRMEGEVFFGATHHVGERLAAFRQQVPRQRHLLVMARSMNFVDLAGDRLWLRELRQRRSGGGNLYFHRPRSRVLAVWRQSGLLAELGEDQVFATKGQAITAIVSRLDPDICAGCQVRIFRECAGRPGGGM